MKIEIYANIINEIMPANIFIVYYEKSTQSKIRANFETTYNNYCTIFALAVYNLFK